jgi:fimbrial chaperone protein
MRLVVALTLLAVIFPGFARAQSNGVQVTPVIIEMAHGRNLASVRIHNWRDQEVSFELSMFRWDQENGEDILTPAENIVVAPSVFAVGAGAEQIVRLALPAGGAGDSEQAYRLILRELPVSDAQDSGFRIQLQMSLPVFVAPRETVSGLSVRRDAAGSSVVFTNTGNARIRLMEATFGGESQSIDNLPRYLLAGEEITRTLRRDVQSLNVLYAPPGALAPLTESLSLVASASAPRLH